MASPGLLLRSDLRSLTADLDSNLDQLWRTLDTPGGVETMLRDTLPDLIDAYGSSAAALTADWYDNLREDSGARGRFTAIPAEIADSGAQALIGWAAAEALDLPSFQSMILGGAQRRIANFSRLTVTGSATADRGAQGWERAGVGECDFCQTLLGRGAVYSEASADFEAHDNCHCVAVPAFL